ncbi:uncharacterized protein LOC117122814 [Anneissia japonica]|uniref:uncharacterized protein LOC117122814 n=1 Tax=Anneissia japonica TaxID=1529436 RepID=UPI0014256E74|nr:uncharacterized protein LOC117122814 [Anneissia japonica]
MHNMLLSICTKIFRQTFCKSGLCQVFICSSSKNGYISSIANTPSLDEQDQEVNHISSLSTTQSLGEQDQDGNQRLLTPSHIGSQEPIKKLIIEPNTDQIATVLGWMNDASEKDFQNLKNVSNKLAGHIIDLRTSQGSLNSLNDLLEIPGIGEKTLSRICENILNPKLSGNKTSTSQFSGISTETLQNVDSIVSLSIGLKQIGWVHLNRGLQLNDWKVHELSEDVTPTKWDPFTYFVLANDIISQLPDTELYLLEHKRYVQLNNNKSVAQVYIFLRAIESLFYATLNTRCSKIQAVSMSESITCRHFDLTIGNRRKSGQKLVEAFLNDDSDIIGKQGDSMLQISPLLAGVYQSANKYQREVLANALLQCLAFYDKKVSGTCTSNMESQ